MENDNNITCDNCGGTDFTTEGGFYYCTECQTQSQDIREQVFEVTDNVHVLEKKITLQKQPNEINKNKLTSWEIYNYILRGLVQELQSLGLDDNFKQVTYHLWLKYLTKLEFISENHNEPAKLGALYTKRDAEIVFQRKYKRKRTKSNASSISTKDMDDRMKFSMRSKHRKLMEKAEYDSLSQTIKSESQSLANQTLSGLSSDDESTTPGNIILNKRSRRELRRQMTKQHLDLHLADINNQMTCHKNLKHAVRDSFVRGPEVLTRNKLYGVIYLASLLTQQDMQISDMLRYCREGHLSFLDYKHFFEEVNEKSVDHKIYKHGKSELPSYEFVRTFTYQLYQFLELRPCDFSPSVLKLCRRFCTELNLPDQVYNIAGDYINKTRPFMQHLKLVKLHGNYIPNYEGRAMGFIIYVLKILFGFDDITEYELSKFAQLVNKKNVEKGRNERELFNFSDWFTYIEYRKIVLKHVHFPTWHLLHPNKDCPLDLYVKFFCSRKTSYEIDNLSANVAKKFLADIELLQDNQNDNLIEFESSITPFRSYLDKLQTIPNFKVLDQTLNQNVIKDASKHTIEYLIDPKRYLKQIKSKKKCSIIFNNAHPNHKLQRICPFVGEFFQDTWQHWEQKWNDDFAEQKADQLAFDKLMTKILDKHISNVKSGPNLEVIKNYKPEVLSVPEDARVTHIKQAVSRTSGGKFCKKTDPRALDPEKITPVKRGKWHVSTWNKTELVNEYNPSLLHQVRVDLEVEAKNKLERTREEIKNEKVKHLNNTSKYKYHYIPRMEYCSNIREVSRMSKEKFKEFEATLPKNFQWLLTECARILEQPTKELYQEFVNVEVYMNYIYFQKLPVQSKPISNDKAILRIKKHVEKHW